MNKKNYRITYSYDKEEIFTAIIQALDLSHAITLAKQYIDQQDGLMKHNEVVGLGILEID